MKRGLMEKPEDWRWSSFRHWRYVEEGTVKIDSEWTFRKSEKRVYSQRLREDLVSAPCAPF